MNRKTFHVTFFLRRARTSKAGLTPILAHISTDGISKEVYIQCSVAPEKWSQAKERATGKDKLCQQVNAYLDENGVTWIRKPREKTAEMSRIPLLPYPDSRKVHRRCGVENARQDAPDSE